MNDRDSFVVLICFGILVVALTLGATHAARENAIENCIKANSDWTVAAANEYCNLIIREGKRP